MNNFKMVQEGDPMQIHYQQSSIMNYFEDDDVDDYEGVQNFVKEYLRSTYSDSGKSSVNNSKGEDLHHSVLSNGMKSDANFDQKEKQTTMDVTNCNKGIFTESTRVLRSMKQNISSNLLENKYVVRTDKPGSGRATKALHIDVIENADELKDAYFQYQPTDAEKLKLASFSIKIAHPSLPQHKVETTAGTRTLNENERKKFQKHALLKVGKFNHKEEKQIKMNWESFCEINDWDRENPAPFLYMQHRNKTFLMSLENRKKFVQTLAHKLPDRSLYSVYCKFKLLYNPHKMNRYTLEEDEKILNFIPSSVEKPSDENDHRFATLANILKRTRASVWRRYRLLNKQNLIKAD